MQTCSWGNCPNQFPDHYISNVCGARHILVIGDEAGVKGENLPLSGESYRYQIVSVNDERIAQLAEKATAILIFTEERVIIGELYPEKTLIVPFDETEKSMNRLRKFLLASWKKEDVLPMENC